MFGHYFPTTAADQFLDIDLTEVTIDGTRGVEPSPFHLSRDPLASIYYINIMTLRNLNGTQMGSGLRISPPAVDAYPVSILWSKHFMPTITRGVEPSPFIVMNNCNIYRLPLTYASDGSPTMLSSWELVYSFMAPTSYGTPTCMAELPGTQFGDGMPRLYVGTDMGYVFWLVETAGAGITLEGAFYYIGGPVLDLEPIPQYGYIALGMLKDNIIYGLDPRTARDGELRYAYNFRLTDPRAAAITDFDVIGDKDSPLADPGDMVKIVIANGTDELGIATLPAGESGDVELAIVPDSRLEAIGKIATNALLLLPANQESILFDPHFDGDNGSSGCAIDLTVIPPEPCYAICGDVNNDGLVDILDIVSLINYKYKGGSAPYIYRLGDVDGVAGIDILDIVYMINYKYKSGNPPNCE